MRVTTYVHVIVYDDRGHRMAMHEDTPEVTVTPETVAAAVGTHLDTISETVTAALTARFVDSA